MRLVEPIDNRLEVDAQCSANCSEAHPLKTHLDSLGFEGRVVAHWFLVRGEVALATLTPHTLGACVVSACFHHSC